MKDGDHLVRSTKNPERVRGQSRDANNKNPDIIEWEEVEVDEYYNYEPISYDDRQVELTPEEEWLVDVGIWVIETKVAPWVKDTAWPWIKEKGKSAFSFVKNKKKNKQVIEEGEYTVSEVIEPVQFNNVSTYIDEAFEHVYVDMDEQEIKDHILKVIYHMLEIANEIRILSNAQIRKSCESEKQYLNRVKETEKISYRESSF